MSYCRSPEYMSWQAMKTRCLNPKRKSYKNYGGRGITICQQWIDSFETFLSDMGPRPSGHTIERIESNGNYEPGNCKWATRLDQGRNTSRVIKTVVDGSSVAVRSLADQFSISGDTLVSRAKRHGIEKALADSAAHKGLFRQKSSPAGVWAQDGDDSPYIGTRFGRLTVERRVGVNKLGRIFLCSCDCGGKRETNLGNLVTGQSNSCGCWVRELAAKRRHEYNQKRREAANAL
jgi:hypothetical protein